MATAIHLKAYRCPDGREIHYAAARLRRDANSPTSVLGMPDGNCTTEITDDPIRISSNIGACWVFFYPVGPNRRILEAIINHYAPHYECDKDTLFLCINRPGKGGTTTSSPPSKQQNEEVSSPNERQHILTSLNDVVTILDYYGIGKASLFYMCAGSTFAYSFAATYPERTTGYIIGIASWILRSNTNDASSSISCQSCNNSTEEETDDTNNVDIKTPRNMNSLVHRLAMQGMFGPKRMVSYLAGGIVGNVSTVFSSIPPAWVGEHLKESLSDGEKLQFDEKYPDATKFVDMMKWMHNDGVDDDEVSTFVSNGYDKASTSQNGNMKDGDARDIAVCLSTQQDLGLVYKTQQTQHQVLLWHGENDKMVSVSGAEYLESMITNASLMIISEGTHQGVMFFFPNDVMDALNRISRDVKHV